MRILYLVCILSWLLRRILAIVWMVVGITFYSYTIGSMTNMVSSFDEASQELNAKLSILKEFKQRTSIHSSLYNKVKRHIQNNHKSANSFQEQEKLLNELPKQLRDQIIKCTHGEIVDRIDFFKNKESEFLFLVMPELKPLKLLEGDILYEQHDFAEEVYLIKNGKVKLLVDIVDFIIEENPSIFLTEQNLAD